MTKQELAALCEYAEHLEKTEKGSNLYNQVKATLLELYKEKVEGNAD